MATFYYELASGLRQIGHEVLVVTLTEEESHFECIEGIRVWRCKCLECNYANLQNLGFLPGFSWNFPRAAELYRRSQSVLAEFKPDIIECVESGFEGLFFALSQNVPLIVRCLCPQFHLLEIGYAQQKSQVDRHLVSALEYFVIGRASAITTPSSSLAKIVSKAVGLAQDSIKVIRNPLMASQAEPSSDEESFKRRFPRLLFTGRIEKLKGCDLLIQMLFHLVEEFPDVELLLVGSESQNAGENESFATRLKREVDTSGLSENVRFLGSRPRTELRELIAKVDLCLFPSRFDSSPYACLEAMSCGATVIASRVGGIPEYVEHGSTGWLVEPDNAIALADSVSHLIRNSTLRARLGQQARESILDMCDSKKIAEQSVELYKDARASFYQSGGATNYEPFTRELLGALDAFCHTECIPKDEVNFGACNQLDTGNSLDSSATSALQRIGQLGIGWELIGKALRYTRMMLRG